jgi:hypothetical protein
MGHEAVVLSKHRKSQIYGAQYLHQPIPGVDGGRPMAVRYVIKGSPEEYLKKVYGAKWNGSISDELRGEEHLAWDMRHAYNTLWMNYSDLIQNHVFSTEYMIRDYEQINEAADLVINTMPRNFLCVRKHEFRSTNIWAAGDAPEDGTFVPHECALGDIIYNGEAEPAWYRLSNIFGHKTVEWPGDVDRPPLETVSLVGKPINHNCDCWPAWKHVGRFGRWNKDKHVHGVFADVREMVMLEEMKR